MEIGILIGIITLIGVLSTAKLFIDEMSEIIDRRKKDVYHETNT